MWFWLSCTPSPVGDPPQETGVDPAPLLPIHDANLVQHGPKPCADPSLRGSLGAFEQVDLGEFASVGFFGFEVYTPGIAVDDFDQDGVMDVITAHHPARLYLHQDGTWVDASTTHLPSSRHDHRAFHVTPVDIEGDGDTDLYVSTLYTPDALWRNDGTGHFVDFSVETGVDQIGPYQGNGSAWGDLDGDGDLDAWISNRGDDDDTTQHLPVDPNQLLENVNGVFVARQDSFLSEQDRVGYTLVSSIHDFDADGDQDIFMVNDFGADVAPNRFLQNSSTPEQWSFQEVGETFGLGLAMFGMGVAVGDLNGDLRPDLVISDWGRFHLMESAEGAWFDTAGTRGPFTNAEENRWIPWGLELADLDNDMDLDLAVGFGPNLGSNEGKLNPLQQPDGIYLQKDDETFVQVGGLWGFDSTANTRGVLATDFNQDGWIDLFSTATDAPPTYHQARCGNAAWLQIVLEDAPPNAWGIGARIEVEVGEERWTRWVSLGSTSMAASQRPVAHFGLGTHEVVDRVTVTWPDGDVSIYQVMDSRQRLTIRR